MVNAYPRLRYPIPLEQGFVEVYAGVPVGFSVLFPQYENDMLGWNIGVLAGVQLFFGKRVGLVTEVGWLRQEGSDATDYDHYTAMQFVANMGIAFLLGS
jgi:hypothetical protein